MMQPRFLPLADYREYSVEEMKKRNGGQTHMTSKPLPLRRRRN